MTDEAIVDLYWQRHEDAITQSSYKYGKRCNSTAFSILQSSEDAEECVNDTYLRAWNLMPDQRPKFLGAFLVKITRNLALDKFRRNKAQKRWNGEVDIVLEELEYCVSGADNASDKIDEEYFYSIFNSFLAQLNEDSRNIFIDRYFNIKSVREISKKYKITESKVKVSLHRSRENLRKILVEEGLY